MTEYLDFKIEIGEGTGREYPVSCAGYFTHPG
jgi:hypothetical protein